MLVAAPESEGEAGTSSGPLIVASLSPLGAAVVCRCPAATLDLVSSSEVAKWAPMPVVASLDEISHWLRALQMLRRCDQSSRTTKRTKQSPEARRARIGF